MNTTEMRHTHHYQGQTLRHAHEGGENQHGYYEHPEDFPKVPAGEGEYEPEGQPVSMDQKDYEMNYSLVFTNVNEEGQPYDVPHDNLEDALRVLNQFPNDHIKVTLEPTEAQIEYEPDDEWRASR